IEISISRIIPNTSTLLVGLYISASQMSSIFKPIPFTTSLPIILQLAPDSSITVTGTLLILQDEILINLQENDNITVSLIESVKKLSILINGKDTEVVCDSGSECPIITYEIAKKL
ncbi:18522_t:CDS:2, partial [Acaulospora morrowiae]